MAKKGQYSAEAIIGRAQQQADIRASEFEAVKEKVAKPEKPPAGETPAAPQSAMQIYRAGETAPAPATMPGGAIPFTPSGGGAEWDYRTAQVDMQGRPLQSRSFLGFEIKPLGFDPLGKPNFGEGGKAWLQKWGYYLAEEMADRETAQNAWAQYAETSQKFSDNFFKGEYTPLQALPKVLFGDMTLDEAVSKSGEQLGLYFRGVQEMFQASQKSIEALEQDSVVAKYGHMTPLSYSTRLVNAALGMTLEAFTWASELPERGLAVNRAMREYADANGSILPNIAFDDDGVTQDTTLKFWDVKPGQTFGFGHDAGNFATRLIAPLLQTYDIVRFATAPGSLDEKKRAMESGWTEGRMLYTELFKETVRQDFISRVEAGDDPYLLTMELEDPWIEAAGEIVLDPLNFLGAFGKAKKAASFVDEATRVVTKNGLLNKAEFVDDVAGLGNITNDLEGAKKLENITSHVIEESAVQSRRIGAFQGFKWTSFTPDANKIVHRKVFGNYFATITQAIRNSGGSADDVGDFLNAIRKLSSGDRQLVKEGLATISHMPLKVMAFNDAAFEVGYFLNRIMGDGDLIRDLQKAAGDFAELNKILDARIDKAMDYAFPSVKEMARASEKAAQAAKTGAEIDEATKRLSAAYKALLKQHPGYVRWAKFHDLVDATLKPINAFLSNNYFSLSYGYAFRNLTQNLVTLWIDNGITFAEGLMKYDRNSGFVTPGLDNFILKQNGGRMPDVFDMSRTFIGSTTEGSAGKRFFNWLNQKGWSPARMSQAFEVYSGKMIYVKKYKATMDAVAVPGGLFPEVSKWIDAGYTAEQAQDFTVMFRANDYDMAATAQAFARKYAGGEVDKWRLLDWVQPKAKKGLGDYGDYWDNIVRAANDEKNTYTDVLNRIDELKTKIRRDANKAGGLPAQVSDNNPLARAVMDDAVAAGKYQNQALDNKLLNLNIHAEETAAEYRDALTKLYRKAPEARSRKIFDAISETAHFQRRQAVLRQADELRNGVIALRDKAAKASDLAALWDTNLMGALPKGVITRDVFLSSMWDGYYRLRGETWMSFYDDTLKRYMEFAKASPEMAQMFDKANLANLKLQQARNFAYGNKGIRTVPPKIIAAPLGSAQNGTTIRTLAVTYGVGTNEKQLLNIVNKYSGMKFASLNDVPPDVAEALFSKRMGFDNMGFVKKMDDATYGAGNITEGLPVPPARDSFVSPNAHAFMENRDGALEALNHIRDGIRERAGLRVKTGAAKKTLDELMPDIAERMSIANAKSRYVAEKYRDFALLPYGEKKNFDLALGMVYPYQFWYSRTYSNWLKRAFGSNPEIISRYANLKEALANEQRDLPDWWKTQLNVTKLFGVETDNPVYINLEAALFPLYGLTGTDFNEPRRRVDWWTATLDDMGKFGPSVFAPIQLATAAMFLARGERDVASLWGQRMIPSTATFKAVSSFFGTPIELDPAVQMFSGDHFLDFQAADPHEEGRIARALAAMKSEGVPEEQLIEAAWTHSGALWDEAYQRATRERAPGQILSFFLGTGYKTRSQSDVEIDRFYSDYYRMKNLRDAGYMTPDQYRLAFDKMRETYPFMDVLLLTRRAGDGRDAAYAYNIMNRIPPGMSSEFYEAVKIDPETAQKFYDSGGQLDSLSETEQQRFMAAMIDLGAMLKIPNNTTRAEWTRARMAYNGMKDELAARYGEDIHDKISRYYAFSEDDKAQAYLDSHPEVKAAMDAKNAMTVGTPTLMKYYGGIETLETYYTGKMYDTLEAEFGADIFDVEDAYYAELDPDKRKAFKKAHPELKEYWKRKDELKDENLRAVVEFGSRLPDAPMPETTGKTPENPSEKRLDAMLNAPPAPTFAEWQQELGAPMTDLIQDYWFDGEELPSTVTGSLNYMADDYGFENGDEFLKAILMSMQP